MQAPPHSNSYFYDYKEHHSIHLLAYIDAYKKFIIVEIGAAGRQSNGVFNNSKTGQMIMNHQLNIPPPQPLVPGGCKLPYIFLGDEAFGLSEFTLTSYPRSSKLDMKKKVLNYRQSRARRIVECGFGRFVKVWQLFDSRVKISLPTLLESVKACVCLHNFIIMKDSSSNKKTEPTSNTQQCEDLEENLYLFKSDRARQVAAVRMRDCFADYFMNEGAVPFQWKKANNADF
ncbi:uncharacterized protein LOC106646097 [Copidosoma floridanum]|uniref:uncharacterized protein LOC106646097 n=1 Tax=Copidosoma floridanum TaxID=29053 RepID=UPI0006C9E3D9|nr:uncharacterized protein LOC106646097 [Copidosoma floridanum]